MATIDKKLIHFNSEANFNTALQNNQIKDTSIAFVGDNTNAIGKKIYTHGETYITHYEGTDGVSVNDDKIGLSSPHILYFTDTVEFDTYLEEIGGEDNIPVPCVILINSEGAVIYGS